VSDLASWLADRLTPDRDLDRPQLARLSVEIGTTDMTGGTLALTSANCTPLGVVVAQGAAPTAGNRFDDDDTLSIEAASVTAFAEGEITVYLVVELDN